MPNSSTQAVAQNQEQSQSLSRQVLLVVGASLLMAILAQFSMPLPFTPVVLTVSNLGVLFIALTLGSRRAAAAMLLYLAEGAMGLPVFSHSPIPGGIAQILGPTGGYLMAYPIAAFAAGWIAERGARNVWRFSLAAVVGEVVLFAGGIAWLMSLMHVSFLQAASFGIYPFAFGEIIKVMAAVAAALRLRRSTAFLN